MAIGHDMRDLLQNCTTLLTKLRNKIHNATPNPCNEICTCAAIVRTKQHGCQGVGSGLKSRGIGIGAAI